jgi:hypothetical protein
VVFGLDSASSLASLLKCDGTVMASAGSFFRY